MWSGRRDDAQTVTYTDPTASFSISILTSLPTCIDCPTSYLAKSITLLISFSPQVNTRDLKVHSILLSLPYVKNTSEK
jgi:hypothetical protein